MRTAKTVAFLAAAATAVVAAMPVVQQSPRPTTMAGRSAVYAPNAAIATSQPLAMATKYSVHHRGQLSTYLRPMGGKVPGIYGPSADTQ